MSIIDEPIIEKRKFEVGTTGWLASDLDDPEFEREWLKGRYEIISGVLSKMAPAYFKGGESTFILMMAFNAYAKANGPRGSFSYEVDIIMSEDRVVRADAAFLSTAERKLQNSRAKANGNVDTDRARILVAPTLIIESVSPGHERHDLNTKHTWYAEFGVPEYWVLNAFKKKLDCFTLKGGAYKLSDSAQSDQTIQPASFPGLLLPLSTLWAESA